jgi:hypothetical protein
MHASIQICLNIHTCSTYIHTYIHTYMHAHDRIWTRSLRWAVAKLIFMAESKKLSQQQEQLAANGPTQNQSVQKDSLQQDSASQQSFPQQDARAHRDSLQQDSASQQDVASQRYERRKKKVARFVDSDADRNVEDAAEGRQVPAPQPEVCFVWTALCVYIPVMYYEHAFIYAYMHIHTHVRQGY